MISLSLFKFFVFKIEFFSLGVARGRDPPGLNDMEIYPDLPKASRWYFFGIRGYAKKQKRRYDIMRVVQRAADHFLI
jgi:hypothetical protein